MLQISESDRGQRPSLNDAAALRRADQPIAPRDVTRAIGYMQARLGSPISVADIAEASGAAGRTLFKHFRDYRGISPMRYLRDARFERAREALSLAQPEARVTEIAMTWGFSHLGRFSVEYRKRFGERPSQTLRRSADVHRHGLQKHSSGGARAGHASPGE